MMIWDYIRDFIVQNIFGGTASDGESYIAHCGLGFDSVGQSTYAELNTVNTYVPIDLYDDVNGVSITHITIGDWLSTTTTIIIMALAVVLMCLLVRWIWRVVSSAMLLK